jgi:predicted dienelactone hydrolase
MMKTLHLLLAIGFLWHASEIVARAGEKDPSKQPGIVGFASRDFVDQERKNWQGTGPRPLATTVWYPATAEAKMGAPHYGVPALKAFFAEYPLAEGAEISRQAQKYPLIMLSHGSMSVALSLDWLGYYLASQGYIVAAVNHHGDTQAEPGGPLPQAFGTPWERAIDLSVLINKMLADPFFGPHIDANRIAAAGHSAGGATVIDLAGGVFSEEIFQEFCKSPGADPNCDPPPMIKEMVAKFIELAKTDPIVQESVRRGRGSYTDSRIKAVFAMAPAIGIGHTEASLRAIRVPVGIAAGRADDITPLTTNAERYGNLITTATLTVLPGKVGHATFGSLCTPAGKKAPEMVWVCRDEEGVDRATVHREVGQLAFETFQKAFAEN